MIKKLNIFSFAKHEINERRDFNQYCIKFELNKRIKIYGGN